MDTFDEKELTLLLDKLFRSYSETLKALHHGVERETFVYYVTESLTPPRVPGRLREVVERWTKEA